MVRKQLYLDDVTDRELVRRAKVLGVSQAEVVRRAVDQYLAGGDHDARMRAIERLKAMWAESDARGVGSGGQKWTREELHERGKPWEHTK